MRGRLAFVCAAVAASAGVALALDPVLKKRAKEPDPFVRADVARELANDGSPDAVALLVELLQDESADVRDHAVIACDALTRADSIALVAAAAKTRVEMTRRCVAEALSRTKQDAALAPVVALALKDANVQVRADALDALVAFEGKPKALDAAKAALEDKEPFARAAAVDAYARLGGEKAVDGVAKALADPDDGVRCVARAALASIAPAAASAGLADAAKDRSWRVRAQCVDDALTLRDAPAVGAIVPLVGDEVLRVAAAAHRALRRLSGKEIGRDVDLWKSWWEANREKWAPPASMADDVADDPKKTAAHYHGLEIATDAAIFVADLSGSMRLPAETGRKRSRWDVAATELRTTLEALPDTFTTNLVFFQTTVKRALPKPAALAKPIRADLERFIAGANPEKAGDLLGAVLSSINQEGIDTIFLLSDGAPSAGDMVDKVRVRAAIHQVDRMRKVVIDSIGFGAKRPTERRFLEAVARDSGGRCVFRDAEGK